MTEYFDVIDKNNNVIGLTTKAESHQLGLPHRVVAVFIFNEKNEILINRRRDDGLLDQSVGGHVASGEDPLAAAKREMAEEVGLSKAINLIPVANYLLDETERGQNIFHWFYLYQIKIKDFIPVIQPQEVIEVFWRPFEDVCRDTLLNPEKYSLGFISNIKLFNITK